jgi:hypothetical protein
MAGTTVVILESSRVFVFFLNVIAFEKLKKSNVLILLPQQTGPWLQ